MARTRQVRREYIKARYLLLQWLKRLLKKEDVNAK